MDLSVPRPWLARNFYLLPREHLDYVQMWGHLRDFVMEMLSDKISEVLWWMNLKWPWSVQTHSWFQVSDVFILMKRKLATTSFPAHTLPCCFFLPVSTLVSSLVSRMREADVHLSSTIAHLLKKKKIECFSGMGSLLMIATYIYLYWEEFPHHDANTSSILPLPHSQFLFHKNWPWFLSSVILLFHFCDAPAHLTLLEDSLWTPCLFDRYCLFFSFHHLPLALL